MFRALPIALLVATPSCAFVRTFQGPPSFTRTSATSVTQLDAKSPVTDELSRADVLDGAKALVVGAFASMVSSTAFPELTLADDSETAATSQSETTTLDSGVQYKVTKAGDGPKPEIGELVAVRFKAFYGSNVIDDIFDTPEPYYTRVGAGGLLKGVEEVIPKMRVGDRWVLNIPSQLAFGPKGRPASAGKPRIPGNADIVFDIEMVGLPGREPELIELIGDV